MSSGGATTDFCTESLTSKQTDTAAVVLVTNNIATKALSSSNVISCLRGSLLLPAAMRSISLPSQSAKQKLMLHNVTGQKLIIKAILFLN